MRWYRTHRGFLAALMLFALALQTVLSFGHIHPRDFMGVAAAGAQVSAERTSDPNGADRSADGYCLVCATMSLAGTLLLPTLTELPVPADSIAKSNWHLCVTACPHTDHASFRARAPPFA
jgi:hypothetical protein